MVLRGVQKHVPQWQSQQKQQSRKCDAGTSGMNTKLRLFVIALNSYYKEINVKSMVRFDLDGM